MDDRERNRLITEEITRLIEGGAIQIYTDDYTGTQTISEQSDSTISEIIGTYISIQRISHIRFPQHLLPQERTQSPTTVTQQPASRATSPATTETFSGLPELRPRTPSVTSINSTVSTDQP